MTPATVETTRDERIAIGDGRWLDAEVTVPGGAKGVVVFAHGSGGSRRGVRNQYVARELNGVHLATVLPDLLTEAETRADHTHGLRMNIPLLAQRIGRLVEWANTDEHLAGLPIGLFGASTGAAAALMAAAMHPDLARAVVSRGGRPDLAERLEQVAAPTLLIVGGRDPEVIRLNELAMHKLRCAKRLEIVPGATHLFEERGTLEHVAALARRWFLEHLQPTVLTP